ncbi:hypothetical protein [Kitasatospora sp. NPDC058218]|uniref:hypothetical protein n=1 Tax=Kitasatospora sp. NPDC058218 TaxID=3346385 RepID=UPI0036DCA8D3
MPTIDDHDDCDDRGERDGRGDHGERVDRDGRDRYDDLDDDCDGADHDDLADFDAFLRVSAGLTGFDEGELRATGMAHEHHRTLLARRVRDEHALIHLWYVGAWPGEPPSSPRAYDRGLMWRTFQGAAPGAAAPGHGSWAEAPLHGGGR